MVNNAPPHGNGYCFSFILIKLITNVCQGFHYGRTRAKPQDLVLLSITFFVEQRAYIIEIMSRGMGTALFLIALSSREEKTVKVTVGWMLMGTEVQK